MTGTRTRVVIFIVLAIAALAGGTYLALRFDLVWALLIAPIVVVIVGFIAQAAGILSREEPK